MTTKSLPPSQRPRCLYCDRPLRAQYTWPEENEAPTGIDSHQRWDWRKKHKFFSGHYGDYKDDRFCGLNCGYRWAVAHTNPARPQKGAESDRKPA